MSQGDDSLVVKAGSHLTKAAKDITLQVGSNSIKIDQTQITIKAMKINLQADLKVDMKGAMIDAAAQAMLNLKGGLIKIN